MDLTGSEARQSRRISPYIYPVLAALSAALGGLAVSRLLYETLFPRALWLGHPAGAMLLALLSAAGGILLWNQLQKRQNPAMALAPLLPLWLNLYYLLDPVVDPVLSRILCAGSLWLGAVFLHHILGGRRGLVAWLVVALLPVYLFTMSHTVGTADTFEFQVVIPRLGVVHPTGYPLYMLLGRVFTFLPISSVAWQLNFASAVFATGAACMVYALGLRLAGRALPALLAALLLGLLPTFWSQAIQAEVYALHALFVATALFLIATLLSPTGIRYLSHEQAAIFLALVLGLGLAHHLTTVFLLPVAGLALIFTWARRPPAGRTLLWMALAFLLPLLLYAYLPLRWAAVNGEPMGLSRFLEWIAGRRFQGALQLSAWYSDLDRYRIVGRLFLAEWVPWPLLLFIPLGVVTLLRHNWRMGLILLLTWLGFTAYAINYYVADLAVFLLPAHLVMAVFWGLGLSWLVGVAEKTGRSWEPLLTAFLLTMVAALILIPAGEHQWPNQDRSADDGRTTWARAVLDSGLPPGAAILADSAKFPPLYYLQQAEGIRPDLDIMILPDEAAYRAELTTRLAAGQPVYLARFLPGLEGSYHLRSAGPLTAVATTPLHRLPAEATPADLVINNLSLAGYELQAVAPHDPQATALTLYWQAGRPVSEPYYIYTRWAHDHAAGPPIPPTGQHPANNTYPTTAWQMGEMIPDFHLLPRPVVPETTVYALQVAVAPPFSPPADLTWHTVATLPVDPPQNPATNYELRARLGSLALTGSHVPAQTRPEGELPLLLAGYGSAPQDLVLTLRPAGTANPASQSFQTGLVTSPPAGEPFVYVPAIAVQVPPGQYAIFAAHPAAPARCGWMKAQTAGCVLGEVEVAGAPLPAGANNFDDQIALLAIEAPQRELQPGGRLAVTLSWQGLTAMDEDYTVFVQVLDAQDNIVGQVDSWPLQGTFPTSQWPAGERIEDPYAIQLSPDLPAGPYRLAVGWYLLETLQRLPVLDENGDIIDDRVILSGFVVP